MTQPTITNPPEKRRVNPRVVLLLLALAAVISATVILTDHLSRTTGPRSHIAPQPPQNKGIPQ